MRELAAREGISINQLVATALAEKMSAIMTVDYLEARAVRGSRKKFLSALSHVPDVEPEFADNPESETAASRKKPAGKRSPAKRHTGIA